MSIFKYFSPNAKNILNCRNSLSSTNSLRSCEEQRAFLSGKALEKLGIPPPPKKPLGPYNRFFQAIRPKIIENEPNLSATAVFKLIGEEWSKCDANLKKQYQKEYLLEMEGYLVDMQKYKKAITPEQMELIKGAKEKAARAKERARISEKNEMLGKPKKPITGFIRFLMEKKTKKIDNIKHTEWVKQMSKEWENLSNDMKEKYRKATQDELKDYKEKLLAWEENMIRQGHIDVVRNRELLDKPSSKTKSHKANT